MGVKCKDIANYIESIAPSRLAEEWDNVGLMVGDAGREIDRVLTCLDVTSEVVEEAIGMKAQLILSHHPFIFKGLKSIDEGDVKGRLVHRIIRNDLCVYSAHTNLDFAEGGINDYLAGLLDLEEVKNLKEHLSDKLYKVVVFVPEESLDAVRDAMSGSGAGWIGRYSDCSFAAKGTGTFKPLEGTNPYIGSTGKLEKVQEYRLETVVSQWNLHKTVDAIIKVHPYEEVAYDVYPLEIEGKQYGYGKVGTLKSPMELEDFIGLVKRKLGVSSVRLIGKPHGEINNVAVFGGSFDESLIKTVKRKADILVTGDIKYHTALDMTELDMCVVDAGHYGTEHVMAQRLAELIGNAFPQIEAKAAKGSKDPFCIL